MFLFGILSLVAFTAALPAPLTSELDAPGNDLHISAVTLPEKPEEQEILSPIPEAPELEPLIIIEGLAIEKDKDSNEKEVSEEGQETVVAVSPSKPPSFLSFLTNPTSFVFPNWSSLSFSPSSWNFPSLSSIFGRNVVYTRTNPIQPNYRYVVV